MNFPLAMVSPLSIASRCSPSCLLDLLLEMLAPSFSSSGYGVCNPETLRDRSSDAQSPRRLPAMRAGIRSQPLLHHDCTLASAPQLARVPAAGHRHIGPPTTFAADLLGHIVDEIARLDLRFIASAVGAAAICTLPSSIAPARSPRALSCLQLHRLAQHPCVRAVERRRQNS